MFVAPMKAAGISGVSTDLNGFIVEEKVDGWRAIAGVHDSGAWLETNTGNRITSLPYLTKVLAAMFGPDTVLDGEIVDEYSATGESWNRTQKLCSRGAEHKPTQTSPPLTYLVFDVLVAGGEDMRGASLALRKERLDQLFARTGALRTIRQLPWTLATRDAVDRLMATGVEGVVIKDLASTYRAGSKGQGWFKLKKVVTEDLECTGTYESTAGSQYDGNGVGGLLADRDGVQIRVGTGMTKAQRQAWFQTPELVVGALIEVAHNQGATSKSGKVRHAALVRIRDPRDKAAPSTAAAMRQIGRAPMRAGRGAKTRAPRRQGAETPRVNAAGASRRNYGAMSDAKLASCIAQLRARQGDAYDRCMAAGADPAADLAKALQAQEVTR